MAKDHDLPREPLPIAIASGLQGSTAVNPPPGQDARMQKRKPSHKDALVALNPEGVTEATRKIRRIQSLQEIACGLIWLHSIGLGILLDHPIETEYSNYYDQFASVLPSAVSEYATRTEELFKPRMKDRISADVKKMIQRKTTRREVVNILTNDGPNEYYEPIMMTLADQNLDLEPEREQLAIFLHIIEELQRSIQLAAQESYLPNDVLDSLRKKMDSFGAQYGRSYAKLNRSGKPKKPLVNLTSDNWWEPEKDPHLNEDDKFAKTVSLAFKGTSTSARSSLNFIVPLILLISAVPAGFAFYTGRAEPGSVGDSDFSQAITSCISQILSVTTLIWPTLHHHRLSRLAWFWVWIGASGSVLFATTSIPVYLFLSARWSFGIGFAGTVTQAVVQLQFINAI